MVNVMTGGGKVIVSFWFFFSHSFTYPLKGQRQMLVNK